MQGKSIMGAMPYRLIISMALMISGCSQIQVDLDEQLGYFAEKELAGQTTCDLPFSLGLDEPSSQLKVIQSDDFSLIGTERVFPIGKTLSTYINQAQTGRTDNLLPIHLEISEFHYTFMPYGVGVSKVNLHAKFTASEPLGTIEVTESLDLPWELVNGPADHMYYAVNFALRNTTVKLFHEVKKRMCGSKAPH